MANKTIADRVVEAAGTGVEAKFFSTDSTSSGTEYDFSPSGLTSYFDVKTHYYGSATYDPASLVDGAGATTTVTVTGAVLGDYVVGVSFDKDLQGILLTGWVSDADTVSVRFQNETGGTLDLASGTLRAMVRAQ